MGFLDKIKTTFSKSGNSTTGTETVDLIEQPPNPPVLVPSSIIGGRLQELGDQRTAGNRYLVADRIYYDDERLYSAIELMAIMIQKSIGEPTIELENDDNKMTNEEEGAVEEATKWAKNMDLKRLFYNYAVDLWKYGDAVDVIKYNGTKGVYGLEPLPMHAVTAVEKLDQINVLSQSGIRGNLISRPNFYLVDENYLVEELKQRIIPKHRILHISFNNRRSMVKDNLGRWTFGIWSMAPINSLIGIIAWKQQLIRNDILWRNRALPREWHQLDLSMYDPSKYKGTYTQKVDAARADAQQAINDYNAANARREADQGFTTGMGVNVSWIEPKTSTYADPLPIIDQINSYLGGPSGTPSGLMGGESRGFTSLVHASSFLALRAEIYSSNIQKTIESLMRRHINIVRPGISNDVVERLCIKNRLILDRDRTELAKIIAVLNGAKVFTPDEIRQIWGLDPLTETQSKKILEWIQSTGKQSDPTRGGTMRGNPNSPTNGMQTQGKRQRDILG